MGCAMMRIIMRLESLLKLAFFLSFAGACQNAGEAIFDVLYSSIQDCESVFVCISSGLFVSDTLFLESWGQALVL